MGPQSGRYDVHQVAALARDGRIIVTKRVAQWLSNHGYDVKETVQDVLASLESDARYLDSCLLCNGQTADEYVVSLPEDDWYLKFWVDENELFVDVWSCCWDGVVH